MAEIIEMIHTAYLVHRGVVNLSTEDQDKERTKDLEFGNKMAVLTGDFLLANASKGLSQLYNTDVSFTFKVKAYYQFNSFCPIIDFI